MNRDKACLHPLVWPDVCGHGDSAYIGTTTMAHASGMEFAVDVYVCARKGIGFPLVCLRCGPASYAHYHADLDTFWAIADAYPPWHSARDLLLSQGFAP